MNAQGGYVNISLNINYESYKYILLLMDGHIVLIATLYTDDYRNGYIQIFLKLPTSLKDDISFSVKCD